MWSAEWSPEHDEEQQDQERDAQRIGCDQQRLPPVEAGRDHEEERHRGERIEDHEQGDELVEEVVKKCRTQAGIPYC
jgi:hypothetical protein